MRTYLRWAIRVAFLLVGLLFLSALTAGLVQPELFDYLPESLLVMFRSPTVSELRMHSVHGSVSLDGQPIDEGEIRFVHLSNKFNPDVGKIRKGKYVAQVKEGEHRVEIRAMKEEVQHIPARYNVSTTLRFQARDGEQNFELQPDTK